MHLEGAHTDAAVVDAVLAVDDVVAILDDPDISDDLEVTNDAELADDGAPVGGDPADDAQGLPDATHVHVTVTDAHDPTVTARNVRDAAHRVTGGRVDVTIEEILES